MSRLRTRRLALAGPVMSVLLLAACSSAGDSGTATAASPHDLAVQACRQWQTPFDGSFLDSGAVQSFTEARQDQAALMQRAADGDPQYQSIATAMQQAADTVKSEGEAYADSTPGNRPPISHEGADQVAAVSDQCTPVIAAS